MLKAIGNFNSQMQSKPATDYFKVEVTTIPEKSTWRTAIDMLNQVDFTLES